MNTPTKTAEEILSDHIKIEWHLTLVEIAKDLCSLIKSGLLNQTAGSIPVCEVVHLSQQSFSALLLEFTTVPGGTRYRLTYKNEERGFGGVFERI